MKKLETAVFGGGCFWCTEAVFKELKGVKSVVPGYAGGRVENPSYDRVAAGHTGHAEVIKIEFHPAVISYQTLLEVFFSSHDPNTLNRQGADVGEQYRSVIFYTNDEQKAEAKKLIKPPMVTELEPLDKFYEAENYHHDYYASNKSAPYCQIVIEPKLEKLKKQHGQLLRGEK